jgi:hypothetical protein
MLSLLRLTGNVKDTHVTIKGRFFVHDLTKTVVESLPFPVNNPKAVLNYEEYDKLRDAAQTLLLKGGQNHEFIDPPMTQQPLGDSSQSRKC